MRYPSESSEHSVSMKSAAEADTLVFAGIDPAMASVDFP